MTKLEKQWEKAAGELAGELATMHGVLYNLLTALYHTKHSAIQDRLLNKALAELKASQSRFIEKVWRPTGGAFDSSSGRGSAPERNST